MQIRAKLQNVGLDHFYPICLAWVCYIHCPGRAKTATNTQRVSFIPCSFIHCQAKFANSLPNIPGKPIDSVSATMVDKTR